MDAKKAKWLKSENIIAGYRCVELKKLDLNYEKEEERNRWRPHREETTEVALVCEHGEIYEYSASQYGFVVTNHKVANKLIALLDLEKSLRIPGEDLLGVFPKDGVTLTSVLNVMTPVSDTKFAVEKANDFGLGILKKRREIDEEKALVPEGCSK